jgi:hypothetical protein
MAEFPLDPKVYPRDWRVSPSLCTALTFCAQLSKMLLASVDLGCSEEVSARLVALRSTQVMSLKVLTVVAMLSGDGGKV